MNKVNTSVHNTKSNELLVARYTTLVEMWAHHNTNQLLFPQIIISAVLIVLSLVLNDQPAGKIQRVLDPTLWGNAYDLQVGVGVPLLITGLAIAPMIYAMGRSRRIMQGIKVELTKIEDKIYNVDEGGFAILNHPYGISATIILRFFMIFVLGLPITAVGLLILLGIRLGITLFVILVAFWTTLEVLPFIIAGRRRLYQSQTRTRLYSKIKLIGKRQIPRQAKAK